MPFAMDARTVLALRAISNAATQLNMSEVFGLRKELKGGASLKKQEHFARLKLDEDEKVKRLGEW